MKLPEPQKHVIERAFKLARSGRFTKVEQVQRALHAEGYLKNDMQLDGPTIRKQLRAVCLAGPRS